jgi:hypothetical protein
MNLNIQTNKNLLYNFLLKATLLFQIKRKTMICFSQIVDIALPQHLVFYFFLIIFKSIIRLCKLPSLFGQLILLNFKNYIIRYNFFSGFLFFEFGSKVGRTITHIQHTYIHNIFTYSTNYFFDFIFF